MDITGVRAFRAQKAAFDLHLSAGLPPMVRVDGDVRRMKKKWGTGSGALSHARHVGNPKSDSRRQIRADVFSPSDEPNYRHANHGSVPEGAGREAHHHAVSSLRKSAGA